MILGRKYMKEKNKKESFLSSKKPEDEDKYKKLDKKVKKRLQERQGNVV